MVQLTQLDKALLQQVIDYYLINNQIQPAVMITDPLGGLKQYLNYCQQQQQLVRLQSQLV